MAKRGAQAVLQEEINNNEDWTKIMENPGMYVIDIYSEWCGPCVAMITYLRKIKMELGNEYLNFAIAKSDNINVLKRFRQKSEPYWMFFFDGKLVNVIIGADAPRLIRLIIEELEQYVKYKNGEIHKEFIPISKVTDEEQKKLTEIENYRKQKTKKEKKLRDKRMMKVRERALKQFSYNIQMQTCVMFFPHTVQYIMVEKPLEEGAEELDEPPEPVMIEKRVCEVANSCASKYEELIVIEAKELKLTEDKLSEMFFTEREFLESFPQELIDELLSKNVYSVMLSMPTVKHDTATEEVAEDDENKPVSIDLMGEIELKLSTIIYGDNGSPLNPSPNSKEAKLVLSVLMDDKDKSLLRFVDVGPIYVSPNEEVGIDDAIKFFPYNFDEMDGEIKLWLDQQEIQSEGVGEEYDFGEGEEGIIEEYSSQDQ
ncbi:unnamed protein product [Aphis gossypii]|uniref:Uncharacterized protein n=1 Tax=Aphis gossypii TaxID=80765 RepID=A0A9P0NNR7_APHGO|nr:unnamed protein product [Aphis gossypii]